MDAIRRIAPFIFIIGFVLLIASRGIGAAPLQVVPVQQIVVTATPLPPIPTAVSTPFVNVPPPRLTPTPAPTLIPDSYAPGGENDAVASLWFGRLLTIVFVAFFIWIISLFREIKLYQIEKDTEIKKAEIEAMARLKINPRPILSTRIVKDGERISLNGLEVDKKLILEFLKSPFNDADERGLVVSKWKNSPGWTQADIETILDHLANASMITKRQNGRSCEWLMTPEKRQLTHIFRLSPFELEE